MTPSLAIEYRHRNRGGLLGAGWSLSGLSQITRCMKTIAQDGVAAPPLITTADKFCLDGQRLVVVSSSAYQAPGAEYRTEVESYARIRAIQGASTNGPASFTVEAADGRTYEYGATNDSRIDGATGASTGAARTWALNRIRDRSGNVVDFQYTEDAGSYRVARIQYNANPAAGVAASHEITFTYENRPNQEVDSAFVAGTPLRQVMRLARIDLRYNGSVLRRYLLGYEPALSSGGRSRLASLRECGAHASDCLSPTIFAWQDGVAGASSVIAIATQVPAGGNFTGAQAWNLADINGDGRNDAVWAGGADYSSATIRFRLARANGTFAAAVDSGVPCPRGIGFPFDADGDGRTDLLLLTMNGQWAVSHGGAGGLGPATPTGIAIPPGIRDYRGADLNGDGLGDVAWSEMPDPQGDTIKVRARLATASGGFGPTLTLYSQWEATGYSPAEGGDFLGPPGRRIDLNGDGAEELLMNENYTVARISLSGVGTDRFDQPFRGLVPLDFNDDDCTDFAYAHGSGYVRVRLSACTIGGTTAEMQGPAWSGAVELFAHDWNGDGRDDILLRGTTDWMVAVSRGDSAMPAADTGVPHENAPAVTGRDLDGDGLQDLGIRAAAQLRLRLRSGPVPDLLLFTSDGFAVSAKFEYRPLADSDVYTAGSGADFPEQDVQTNDSVVSTLTTTDGSGTGATASTSFAYEGLRRNLQGRGSSGFRKLIRTDHSAASPLVTETTFRQSFPFTGLPESVLVRQPSGKPVSRTEYAWSKLDLGAAASLRRFPYAATITSHRYELGGRLDGSETVRSMRVVDAIDATSGLVTDATTTLTEIGGGASAGSSSSRRIVQASVLNDTANWCLGRSQAIEITATHTLPGGEPVARNASESWDSIHCRPTRVQIFPGDARWQVTYNLAYDAFGNLASEKVTGKGMTARSVTIDWGARGQLPARVTDPLGKAVTFAWDFGRSQPSTFTDPNQAVTRWSYDAFGRPLRETGPDGAKTVWTRESCGTACDAHAAYLIRQDEQDTAGTTRVSSWLEVDRFDRGFQLESEQPGGGRSVVAVEFDTRGRPARSYLPRWDGSPAPGYWQFAYDALDRPSEQRLVAAGGAVQRTDGLAYDGLSVTQSDSLGHTVTGTRVAWGPIGEVVDAAGGHTRYEYDAFGGLLRVRDALGHLVTSVTYNARGMKVAVDDMDLGPWAFTRDALGETTSIKDAKGQVLRFDYDALGRVTRRTAADGVSSWTWGTSASKHEIGRLAALAGPAYSETFTYDTAGRPASHVVSTDASYRFDFSYDALGLLDAITYPAAGAGSAFKIRHEYEAGRLSRIRNAASPAEALWTLNAQDAAGHALDETLGTSLRVVTGFSPLTGDIEYRESGTSGPPVQDLAWEWDNEGNLLRRRDVRQGLVEDFSYDSLGRLHESRLNGAVNLSLDYDATGNILHRSDLCPGSAPCFAYHGSRRHAVVSAGGQTYAYDANGNMTNRAGGAIAWSSDNLPLSIARADGNSSQFAYGPAGNRWKQVARSGASTETTIYAGGLFEKVSRGGVTTWRHYVSAPGGTALQLRFSDGTPPVMRYLTQDHLGSTDRILDADGDAMVSESFGSFGARRKPDWTAGVPPATDLAKIAGVTHEGFTGHEQLDNLGLVHMNGRVYDPALGRFISADPYTTLPYDGQGLNRYAYVLNDPLNLADPSGFDPVPCLANEEGACARVTVIGLTWVDYMRAFGGAHSAEVASALERDPCGQNGSALACASASGALVSPSSIVLTIGSRPDSSLSTGGRFDALQGFTARIGNLAIANSPIAMLFGADPDFQYFREPDSADGRHGAIAGNAGYFLSGAAGMVRKAGGELLRGGTSAIARSFQGTPKYPGIDRFRDIMLKKGTLLYGGWPGQTAFYTTASALRRAGASPSELFRGLQLKAHDTLGYRTRMAMYEVTEDTEAAFALALANPLYGPGRLPQVVVPSFETSIRFLTDFPIGP